MKNSIDMCLSNKESGNKNKLVVVGMSGGVDSSVAAWILKQNGYKVVGLFMKNWEDHESSDCTYKNDLIDAASVADKIGIDFEYANFSREYKDKVFSIFLKEYSLGRTPNPDILCNSEIKFRVFLDYCLQLGANYIATGHYARIKKIDSKYHLLKAVDLKKDQSYFLYRLNQEQLSRSIFPLGCIQKTEVREIAREIGLHNFDKKDSTGICFIGEKFFSGFLEKFIPIKKGAILTLDGKEIGVHKGVHFYTLGQRKGLGIGGIKDYNPSSNIFENAAWYVARKDLKNNILYVVRGKNHQLLNSNRLQAANIHWINELMPTKKNNLYHAKTRYRQIDSECKLLNLNDNEIEIEFKEKQWAITPGQSVVIYDNDICMGGGIIY
ncbi:tRNA (5-methylaminomethyl-2-thiouridylate)-methyltransferase [Candidatus Kinetoplastibacterium blastocrithidii TCC012E]|uniref:tRNA-specific 2-thiouridylase MnmA n=1 Tax=Candidatus Kinetoplastidibacterium blastocrithidiae TCC012E TaxID=1208922 RepID=M1MDJ1_9PROT|nr:tRNA 2-thiouridine(34) synthase MnmA [Candidatus Kinetoplastibacterium blastocrithidii]AFZ83668.1 tRNA-specific 2-thiouridylase [Candidatus Kinetoplastibacterium blastocrithidii (ex Strigomonas culicis)]AGF49790.1 tRNA (5-methylaminomethyl-2-thiouridylate)-methyltransferase [Candidatus Kinetoplastibacterium blastocrithidii TCC012E]